MKKIGFFILFLPVLLAFGSKDKSLVSPHEWGVINTAQVAQSINDFDHIQVLILLLVTFIFVLLFSIAMYQVVRQLIRIGRAYRAFISNRWIEDPDVPRRIAEESDLKLGVFTEQQWLLSQLLSQAHEDGDAHDFVDLPHDWWC